MSTVLHLVPHFAPQIDGVGDYARLLARQWRSDRGPESRFLIGDPRWDAGGADGEFAVARVEARDEAVLAAALAGETRVLLHYVGYGYDRRGVPGWLPAGLARWRAGGAEPVAASCWNLRVFKLNFHSSLVTALTERLVRPPK